MSVPAESADPAGVDRTGVITRRFVYAVPLLVLAVLAIYFWRGLGSDPHAVPSPLIDQAVPEFALQPLAGRDRGLSSHDLTGQVSLVNVFGSWCVACRVEHPFLMEIRKQNLVPIFAIDWREKDRAAGPAWLARHGDPYTLIGDDPDSVAAIAFGVTGAPETFVVDRRGVIRYKHVGPLTQDIWNETLWPIVQRLRAE
jgi:cytochrome c biogenesis protein CcmG/thiol:disulfide interchange protein DsbE